MMLGQFHFLQPLWLLALFPLALLLWLAFSSDSKSGAWEKIIDPRLLPLLLQGEDRNSGRLAKFLLATAWIITVIALADPVWEKIPRPVFQTNAARVLVLDLSNSMLIDDLKPNRLSRARFKIEDILSHKEEGQTGLVLFAGDAFTASPLTRDTETIRSFLKVLTPQLMPAQGSRADLGLIQAHELLKQSGINNGQVLLIADGVSRSNAAINAAMDLAKDGHTVSVLGVGTVGGGELRFRNNESVSVKLDADVLRNIATQGGGKYHVITTNNADLRHVLINTTDNKASNEKTLQQQEITNEEWKSTGPLLVLLLLPLAALAFRRGWIFNIFIGFFLAGLVLQPQPVMAFSLENFWQTLSENKEQRADNALRQQQFELASELADDPLRRGSAEYKQNKFDEALQSFKQASGADARYNEGNTLAKLKKYKEAIAAYDEALKLEVDMKDALDNKKAIEEMLKKEEEKHKDSENKSESKNQQKDSDMAQQNQQQKSENQQSKDNKDQKGQQQEQNGGGQQSDNNQQSKSDAQQGEQPQKDQSADQEQQTKDDKTGENQFSEANKAMEEEKDREAENDNTKTGEQQARSEPKNEAGKTASAENDPSQQASENENNEANKNKKGTIDEAKALTKEEKMAAEQWLRRIPDDPGGLLRRKFKNQYQQRQRNQNNTEQPW